MKKDARQIGIYVCNCGKYFENRVDAEEVREAASKLRDVVFAKTKKSVCSESGLALIGADVKEHRLTGIVIAACQAQEPKFKQAIESAALSSQLLGIVNMAEQYNTYNDKETATRKIVSLLQEITS